MKTTKVFSWNIAAFNNGKRFIINQGGARSGKTFSLLQLCLLIAQRAKGNRLLSIVSESLPHLKRGAMRDFIAILEGDGLYSDEIHDKTNNIFEIKSLCGKFTSQIEFFGVDSQDKVRGPQRDYLFINECNNINYETFYQLLIRTGKTIFLDFNPVSSFWVHEELIPSLTDQEYAFIKSTYKDNSELDKNQVRDIERRAALDENFKRVYADGEIGNMEGLVYQGWRLVDFMPESKKRCIGVDFGFTNDPTAIYDVRINDGQRWIDQIEYRTGMSNAEIAAAIKTLGLPPDVWTVCDSAEAKSIAELERLGIMAVACEKGAGSVNAGIDIVNAMQNNITKRSTEAIKETRNYRWAKDKSGKVLNIPVDNFNHAMDAIRYASVRLSGVKIIKRPSYSF